MAYWLDLFTWETWNEFKKAGGKVSGFREQRWRAVQRMGQGDVLLCYLTGISRWIGLLEVTGPAYRETVRIWSRNEFPARIPVKVIAELDPETAVPVAEMRERLSMFINAKSKNAWTGSFRGSPAKWSDADGKVVCDAIMEAVSRPVQREYDPAKLQKIPPVLRTAKLGKVTRKVTIPGDQEAVSKQDEENIAAGRSSGRPVPPKTGDIASEAREATAHTEIQWLLLRLGSDMGLDVWVARNDRGKNFRGAAFASTPRMISSLPVQFDDVTNRTIALIDVLWLKGNSIQAAFEIESTTSIFSGLLRMADLITMQPNLKIPLYIVAPTERQQKVIEEVNRPTFARLDPPMARMCRFIAFEELRNKVDQSKGLLQYLKPEFVESFSESCEADEV